MTDHTGTVAPDRKPPLARQSSVLLGTETTFPRPLESRDDIINDGTEKTNPGYKMRISNFL